MTSSAWQDYANKHRNGHEPRFSAQKVDLSQVRPVRFVYRPFLVCGKLNLCVGEEEVGKSTLQAHIAARLTNGELPGEFAGRPGNVLFVGADEDDWNEVVVPRLYAAGADLERVCEFTADDSVTVFNVTDHADELARTLREGDFQLVVFEQLMDALPALRNPNDPYLLRAALRPLRHVLHVCGVAGLATLHVNKAETATLRQKMQGSVQFGALSRSTTLVDHHPADKDRRVAVLGKANYVAPNEPRAFSFALRSKPFFLNGQLFNVGYVGDIEPEDDLTVADVLQKPSDQQRERDERLEMLAAALTEETKTGLALAEETGIPQASVYRLMAQLVEAKRAIKGEQGWAVYQFSSPIGNEK